MTPYWAGKSYVVNNLGRWTWCGWHSAQNKQDIVWKPQQVCVYCQEAAMVNDREGLMEKPENTTNTKYSFVGRPSFKRIIDENPGADVIIVSREDGLVCFLFNKGPGMSDRYGVLTIAENKLGKNFEWATYHAGSKEALPDGWVFHSTSDEGYKKDLRKLAQLFVGARTGKHTVEVLS